MLSKLLRWLSGAAGVNSPAVFLGGTVTIENTVPGSFLHLGDGRKLAFGEKAEVTPELAAEIALNVQATA
jgi:hypothetical protein